MNSSRRLRELMLNRGPEFYEAMFQRERVDMICESRQQERLRMAQHSELLDLSSLFDYFQGVDPMPQVWCLRQFFQAIQK